MNDLLDMSRCIACMHRKQLQCTVKESHRLSCGVGGTECRR